MDNIEVIKSGLISDFYLANDELQTWYDLKIESCEAIKGQESYIYQYHGLCDEIVKNPKLASSDMIVDGMIKIALQFAEDKESGVIMGNLMLAKLYLLKQEKGKAQKCFDIFMKENGKAGGNTTHPSLQHLKASIEAL